MSPRAARPLIAIPSRFSATTSALRFAAEVNARMLMDAVWRSGGEPLGVHPVAPDGVADPADVAARLRRFDGVLLPGGGDLDPARYGAGEVHESVYDVDAEQDGFDLELARQALRARVPTLAICRGLQTVNVALGGTLQQDMGGPDRTHRARQHLVSLHSGSRIAAITGVEKLDASCFHHQRIAALGAGLVVTARAADDTIEALDLPDHPGWFAGVQWHPEDTAHRDPIQQRVFDALVAAAGARQPDS